MALTKTKIADAKPKEKPYRLNDEKGLCLLVTPAGDRFWRLRYRQGHVLRTDKAGNVLKDKKGRDRLKSREKMMGLGEYPAIDIATARDLRDEARKLIANNIDPIAHRAAEKLTQARDTFEAVAREWLAKQKPGKSAGTHKRATWMLEKLTFPWIGLKPIASIKRADVLDVLDRIEKTNADPKTGLGGNIETARRTLQRIGSVFEYAVISERAPVDITAGMVTLLTAKPAVKKHAAITKPAEIGELLRAIDGYKGHGVTVYMLKVAPYVFVRPGELRHMEWSELDLDGAEPAWLIPGSKMKLRRPHIVPLARQVIALLRDLHALTGPTPSRKALYCFPSLTTWTRPMSENTLNTAIRRLGYDNTQMTGHGFRSTASTRLNEGFAGHVFNSDWIEAQLAHSEQDGVRAAYNEAKYLPQRRQMMQQYADYLDSLRAAKSVKVRS